MSAMKLNARVRGKQPIRSKERAEAVRKEGVAVQGLFRLVASQGFLMLCQGNEVLAASPLSDPVFRFEIIDEHGTPIAVPQPPEPQPEPEPAKPARRRKAA